MMRRRLVAINALITLASIVVGLVMSEAASRMVLNPADYLSAQTVPDEVLGITIAPGTAGFDHWGFRNLRVPDSADIVAIGDSHTYGNTATMAEAWPSVVARMTGRSVYNLALGGYGPNQYYHLLETYAVRLQPRWVACGLYLGDDFENAFLMTYGKQHWSFLRHGHRPDIDADTWHSSDRLSVPQRIRLWFARHSVLYQTVVHGSALDRLTSAVQMALAARTDDGGTTVLVSPNTGIREAFRPLGIRERLNQQNPAVREGMRITFQLLELMNASCQAHGCRLLVVLIPTKETVFADALLHTHGLPLRDVIADLVANEAEATAQVHAFLDRAGIPYVDTLPALRRNVSHDLYAHSARDMHPSKNGYRVIGETVAAFFRDAR